MNPGDRKMHIVSGIGTVAVAIAMLGLAVTSADWAGAVTTKRDPFEDMEVIDAALAELPKKPQKQPQKQFKAPEPTAPPEGVTRDDQAKPLDRPEEIKPGPVDPLEKFRRDNNDDEPVGKPDEQDVGAFDGNEFGFGDETRGDPFLGALKADLLRSWEYPEILSDVGVPVGCIHIEPDGKIKAWELREKSGNAELDDSVERALRALETLRDDEPKPVPAHLVPKTRKWICYRMKVKE